MRKRESDRRKVERRGEGEEKKREKERASERRRTREVLRKLGPDPLRGCN